MLIGSSVLILIKTLAVYSVTKSFAIWNCLLLSCHMFWDNSEEPENIALLLVGTMLWFKHTRL